MLPIGCATNLGSPADVAKVRSSAFGARFSQEMRSISAAPTIRAKLDPLSVPKLKELDFAIDHPELIESFRMCFFTSGDYPVVSITYVQQDNIKTLHDIDEYSALFGSSSHMAELVTTGRMVAIIMNPSGDTVWFGETTGESLMRYRVKSGETYDRKQFASNRARAFSIAADNLLTLMQSQADELDKVQARMLFGNW